MSNSGPVVSVCMITYNHEKHIAQAIEGVLIQQTTFAIELVLAEDKSTDNTRKICEQYALQHPEIIRLLPSDKNLGMMPNFIRAHDVCLGTYIATCEGDDYWTDSLKLQKQVDFLDKNGKYSLVGTRNLVLKDNELSEGNYFSGDFDIYDLIQKHRCHPSTFLFRNVLKNLNTWFLPQNAGDTVLIWMCATMGDIKVLPDITSVYRLHEGGIYSSKSVKDQHLTTIKNFEKLKSVFPQFEKEISITIASRKSYFQLYDYNISAVLKGLTPLRELLSNWRGIIFKR